MTYTLDPYFERKLASSMAESPQPTTAIDRLRKMGAAPSQTAQEEMPRFQNSFAPVNFKRRATAPVATITVSEKTVVDSDMILNGREENSTLVTVSETMRVLNFADWALNLSVK